MLESMKCRDFTLGIVKVLRGGTFKSTYAYLRPRDPRAMIILEMHLRLFILRSALTSVKVTYSYAMQERRARSAVCESKESSNGTFTSSSNPAQESKQNSYVPPVHHPYLGPRPALPLAPHRIECGLPRALYTPEVTRASELPILRKSLKPRDATLITVMLTCRL